MKVLLLSDVYKHGVAGEVVDVRDGFARNWLLPKKLAVKATPGALKQAEDLREKAEVRKAQLEHRLNDLGRQIDGTELFFGRRASPTGKLFGSVTTTEIADALNAETGIDINRRRISQMSIREIGTHDVPVRLGTEISPVIKVTVVREEEFARFMEQRKAAQANLGDSVGELASAVAHTVQVTAGTVAEEVSHAVQNATAIIRDVLLPHHDQGAEANEAEGETPEAE